MLTYTTREKLNVNDYIGNVIGEITPIARSQNQMRSTRKHLLQPALAAKQDRVATIGRVELVTAALPNGTVPHYLISEGPRRRQPAV